MSGELRGTVIGMIDFFELGIAMRVCVRGVCFG
jgi:hypothetical protein